MKTWERFVRHGNGFGAEMRTLASFPRVRVRVLRLLLESEFKSEVENSKTPAESPIFSKIYNI